MCVLATNFSEKKQFEHKLYDKWDKLRKTPN